MIKLDNRGRRANNEQLAKILHELVPGDVINIYGATQETLRLANSLSRTHKRHNKSRLSTHALKTGGVTITCIKDIPAQKVIVI